MKAVKISRGGQVSVPASIRNRWKTERLMLDDQGDRVVLTPAPRDPIAAARGALAGKLEYSSRELREMARAEEREAELRRLRQMGL